MRKWTRRAFIGSGSLVGGGFVLGVAGVVLSPSRHSVVSDDAVEKGQLTTWITVTPDNLVTVLVPHCEMGQGAHTALAMMAAEEMEAAWDLVRVKEAPALGAYANAYILRGFAGDSIPEPFGRAVDYGSYRLARWFWTAVDRRLYRGARHRAIRYVRRRRCGEGDANRGGSRAVRGAPVGLQSERLAGHACGVGTKRQLWGARDSGCGAFRAGESGLEGSGYLHDPAHSAPTL